MGRRVERGAREDFALWRKCELRRVEQEGRQRCRLRGKGQIQSLPSVESSNSFPLTSRKSSCNSVMGRTWEGASSFGPSPQLHCSLLALSSTIQPLCSSLFAPSAFSSLLRFPRVGSGGLLCTPCCSALVPTETHTTACCDQ